MGVLEVEIDVQLSKDGKVVLFHDTTLEDKLGRPGGIHDYTWAELRELEIGTWFHRSHPYVKEDFRGTRLVTLEGLLAALGPRLLYHIELKSQEEELPSRVLEVVRRAKLSGRVSLSSFQMEQLVRGHAIDTDIPIDYLVGNAGSLGVDRTADSSGEALFAAQREQIDAARRAGFGMVALPLQDLSREIVAYAHGHGLLIRAWKIRSDEDMDHAIALGTNGMTTNWPNRLIRRQLEHLAGHSHQERQ
jgi:glycerophosphoryl diester phosphodiesterase